MVDINPVEGLDEDGGSHLRTGLLILLVAAVALIAASFYLRSGGIAEGRVTAVVAAEGALDGKPGIHFVPQVTFTLPDGTVITFLDKDSAAAQLPYVIRGTVSVIYDPENPQDAHIGNRNWIWINIAILLSAAGLWFFRGFLNTALDPE
jgi:hypothetical protein